MVGKEATLGDQYLFIQGIGVFGGGTWDYYDIKAAEAGMQPKNSGENTR